MSKKAPASPAKKNAKPLPKQSNPAKGLDPKASSQVPVILEFAFTFSRVMILLVGALVVLVSLFTGVNPLMAALRAGVGMLVVGLTLWGLSWLLAKGSLDAAQA